jgi:predicted acylesterase/phospholipase RssA
MCEGQSSPFKAVPHVLVRLPLGFLVPFVLLLVLWSLAERPVLELIGLHWPESEPVQKQQPLPDLFHSLFQQIFSWSNLWQVLFAFLIIVIYAAGVILIYNASVAINSLIVRQKLKPVPTPSARPYRPQPRPGPANQFQGKSIGIVLAGGGAKGAFQAGAMTAIYRYLAHCNALDNVKVIAGTSIGSWNSLFWLADLIEAENTNESSALKSWWQSISLRSLVAPSWYAPALRNAFFLTTPWEQSFDTMFGSTAVRERLLASKVHFYMVRHQVNTGALACTTNNPKAEDLLRSITQRVKPTIISPPAPPVTDGEPAGKFMNDLKTAVFASMDLPPLFPYIKIDRDYFEDGGVIDNLPIMFAAMEGCEVIFALPLNADFTAEPDRKSIIHRLLRVMDVRQGALEQNNLKGVYLYNELAALREHVDDLKSQGAHASAPTSKTLDRALNRTHKELRIVAICPQRSLVKEVIDTHEFWKADGADEAFNIMYDATTDLLNSDDLDLSNERIEIFEVRKDKGWRRNSNF